MAEISPMMKQYWEIKSQYPNCILFYRVGDFFETYYEDAKITSRALDLVLTGKSCGQEERAPMCGVPFHACEAYVAKMVVRGYKVAICEQLEDPAKVKGIVKRGVIRVVTPGTVMERSLLDEGTNNYLCMAQVLPGYEAVGLCFGDISTGELHVTELRGDDVRARLFNELARFTPREVLLSPAGMADGELTAFIKNRLGVKAEPAEPACLRPADDETCVAKYFGQKTLDELKTDGKNAAIQALGCTMFYLTVTQMSGLERMLSLDIYSDAQFMRLDLSTRRNLELVETMRSKEKRGSLLGVLDHTCTAGGKRLLRSWVEQPLLDPPAIERRQNAVEELLQDTDRRAAVRERLGEVHDLERILTRVVYGSVNAKELRALLQTLEVLPPLRDCLAEAHSSLLHELHDRIDPLDDLRELITAAIEEDPPLSLREGGLIRAGYNAELDELRLNMTDGQGVIARIEAEEKEKTGIKGLRVGYNRVFGYYIEISRSYTGEVPETFIRKQTLANAERYITPELKEWEARVLGAKERSQALEYQLFCEVREAISAERGRIQATATALAELDVLAGFAELAMRRHYVRPTVNLGDVIDIHNGRHPVVESLMDVPFVPNDVHLDRKNERVAILTGPNMAGKSTFMRQTALAVLMAQIGCFVPADKAVIGVVDGIYTRVGASDDLAAGQSTFMVEMSEVADILRHATGKSLIIFDEIGRGTSTFDGMSIARAVLEYVADPKRIGAKTLFATHYHELTVMEQELDGVRNYNIAVKKRGDDITFLRRIVRGPADDSYGIEVAKLAGVPAAVITRAKAILKDLGTGTPAATVPAAPTEDGDGQEQLSFLGGAELVERLKQLDVNVLTPIEALQTLYELNREAQQY